MLARANFDGIHCSLPGNSEHLPRKLNTMKKIVTIAAATAVLAGGIAAPAQAIEAKVEGEKCTITVPAAKEGEKATTIEYANKAAAQEALKKAVADATSKQGAIAELEKKADKTEADNTKLTELKKELQALQANAPALRACANGKDISATSSKIEATLSSVDGKPSDAGIGVIAGGSVLALLALIAVALPQVAPMLNLNLPF